MQVEERLSDLIRTFGINWISGIAEASLIPVFSRLKQFNIQFLL